MTTATVMTPVQQDMEFYRLNDSEKRQVQEILDQMDRDGGMYRTNRDGYLVRSGAGQPIPENLIVLRGARFCVSKDGRVWRYRGKDAPKSRHRPAEGVPSRFNGVEMWRGKWRKAIGPDGKPTFAKATCLVNVEPGGVCEIGQSHIDWWRSRHGYAHPLDPPHAPTARQAAVMDSQQRVTEGMVFAKTQEAIAELMTKDGASASDASKAASAVAKNIVDADPAIVAAREAAKPKRTRKKRTNKRSNKRATDAA